MALRNSQIQKQSQTLKILPQQIQFLNMLQLNAIELDQYINKELEENPYLEYQPNSTNESETPQIDTAEFDGADIENPLNWGLEDDVPDYNYRTEQGYGDNSFRELIAVEQESWRQQLIDFVQLDDSIPVEELKYVVFIIESLADDGKLNQSIESLTDNISIAQNQFIPVETMASALELVQDLDPPGIGARDLKECLILQLDRLIVSHYSVDSLDLARKIIENHLDHLGNHNYEKIKKSLSVETEELKEAIDVITSLNPHPISTAVVDVFDSNSVIIPDYQIEIEGESILVSIPNSRVGAVRVDDDAAQLAKQNLDKKATNFIKTKMEDARWLQEALKQRDTTMMDTMKLIVVHQREFFLSGNKAALKPLVLKDIADKLDLDVSTISRVTSRKYMETPYGIIPVKEMFIQTFVNNEGAAVTTNEVQIVLKQIIDSEDKTKPFNDSQLQKALKEKGFPIARRTVAKYRENMKIPVADKRRELV